MVWVQLLLLLSLCTSLRAPSMLATVGYDHLKVVVYHWKCHRCYVYSPVVLTPLPSAIDAKEHGHQRDIACHVKLHRNITITKQATTNQIKSILPKHDNQSGIASCLYTHVIRHYHRHSSPISYKYSYTMPQYFLMSRDSKQKLCNPPLNAAKEKRKREEPSAR